MDYQVYILRSISLGKFYTGYSGDIDQRIENHNNGLSTYTSKGIPWKMVWYSEKMFKTEALKLERKIKSRGAKRFLEDQKRNQLS